MMMVAVTPTREVLIVETSKRVSHREDGVDNRNICTLQIFGESSTGDEDG